MATKRSIIISIFILFCIPLYPIGGWTNPSRPGEILNSDIRLITVCALGCLGFHTGIQVTKAGYHTCAQALAPASTDRRSLWQRTGAVVCGGANMIIGPVITSASLILIITSKIGLQVFDEKYGPLLRQYLQNRLHAAPA